MSTQSESIAEKLKAKLAAKMAAPSNPAASKYVEEIKSRDEELISALDAPFIPTAIEENSPEFKALLGDCMAACNQLSGALERIHGQEMKHYLSVINQQLRECPELTYLLPEESISAVYASMIHLSKVEISVTQAKKSKKKKSADSDIKLLDLL